MLIILVGPRGSGKSHIGRVLEREFGVRFFEVEPLWMAYLSECREAGREQVVPEGIARIHPEIRQALAEHGRLCVETTGAAQEILDDLVGLRPRAKVIVAKISAPPELCLQRLNAGNSSRKIPMDAEEIRKVNAMSEAAQVDADLHVTNEALGDEEIVAAFQPHV